MKNIVYQSPKDVLRVAGLLVNEVEGQSVGDVVVDGLISYLAEDVELVGVDLDSMERDEREAYLEEMFVAKYGVYPTYFRQLVARSAI